MSAHKGSNVHIHILQSSGRSHISTDRTITTFSWRSFQGFANCFVIGNMVLLPWLLTDTVILSNDSLHEFTLNWVPQLFGFGTATVFCVKITLHSYLLTDTVTSQTWFPPSLQGIHVITFSSRCPLSLMLVDVCPLNQRNILLENTIK